ncbi:MAG: hypothetical protein A2W90_13540 [Bacteroidetes bacterium GWF2_42_66]|nr:MAG: hypothetical protein A2W92_14255 [Bacteroidetes bacterium GWA2_42_15]OFX97368.1 MAG: hypothetical protein A2W89_00715 [Bacteroidetes bacterium GWE2_42_39]OFY40006.1 MAG: hypothetical protein A2W90_13540 [Bacteroidetes bacterium GWF2_42_66]
MIIAKEKRKTNLAEYILYMWQVEDLIRSFCFDIEKIGTEYIARFQVDEATRLEIKNWYGNLLTMMEKERLRDTGHLQMLRNLVNDLNEFHLKLLETNADPGYSGMFIQVQPLINEFRLKMQQEAGSDVETCLNGLYSLMMLRLQKKEVNQSTLLSFQSFGKLMGHLSARYLQFEKGDFEF